MLHRFCIWLVCACAISAVNAEELKAGTFSPARVAPDFSVKSSNGGALQLSAYKGKIILLGFGYTSCLNVCPVTLAVLGQAVRQLGSSANNVQVIYLTVDPERDDAARLKEYLSAFNAAFVGGTGSADEMAAVRKLYGVTAEKHGSGTDYVIAHSSFVYVIDKQGRLRALMPFGHKADDYAHDLKLLLNE
ncbi:MAG TPA: SCO family protein [Steroidobacteraceae bacterium]|nr:SCO family protein [Steroidobacteraceae bacterium]